MQNVKPPAEREPFPFLHSSFFLLHSPLARGDLDLQPNDFHVEFVIYPRHHAG